MTRTRIVVLAVTLGSLSASCSDKHLSAPENMTVESPAGMVVSNPLANTRSASSMGAASFLSLSTGSLSYVSAVAGTFPAKASISVRNRTRAGSSQSALLIDGGFDPIGVESDADDELTISVSTQGGPVTTMAVMVPRRRPPDVVRTSPSKGRTDVALSVLLETVFTEPLERSSVTDRSLALFRSGNAVAGSVRVSDDGLTIKFVPDFPLEPLSSYLLLVRQGVRDLDGDSLSVDYSVPFTTASALPPPAVAELAYAEYSTGTIFRIRADGTGQTSLTNTGINTRPAWSPDRQRIAFASRRSGGLLSDIYIMDSDGSNLVRRTVNADYWSAAWSPDGRKLAVSTEGVYYSDIYLISAGADDAARVHLAKDARSPAWSPDGKQIAFVHLSNDDGYDAIFVMNSDGSNAVPLTNAEGGLSRPAWSPDGERIAFSKCMGGLCDVYVMNADGSNLNPVTNVGIAQEAAWSPDGKWISYTLAAYVGGNFTFAPSLAFVQISGVSLPPHPIVRGGYHPSWRP